MPGRRPQMRALTLGPEQAEELHGVRIRRTEPVRPARVEFGGLTRLQDQVVLAEHHPEPAAQDVEPFIALVCLRVGAAPGTRRDHQLVRLDPIGSPGQRQHRHAVPGDRFGPWWFRR